MVCFVTQNVVDVVPSWLPQRIRRSLTTATQRLPNFLAPELRIKRTDGNPIEIWQ
jgi:hypothetical protein